MKATLHISDDVSIPADAVTQTFGVLAVRGAGKSNLAAALAEEMFAAHLPFVVIDPVGSWSGLRSSGDGKGPGLQIPIFGGRRGDVPLERGAGHLVADLVVDKRMTCVLDVSEFSEGDKTRFLCDFAERLYRRNSEPLHLFLEEADDYCPQRPMHEQARLLRAWENIVRRGRARGLGITMITQRSAALNKNVLTQIETLFVLRTTSPQDGAAIEAWVKYQGGALDMLKTLPTLAAGEAWVWSPSWLKVFKRVRIRRRWTFDTGATPKEVKGKRAQVTLADVDLAAIQTEMAATIERAKQEDPKELRKHIAELEREVRTLKAAHKPAPEPVRIEVPILSDSAIDALKAYLNYAERVAADLREALKPRPQTDRPRLGVNTLNGPAVAASMTALRGLQKHKGVVVRPASPHADTDTKLASGERKILTVLAQYPEGRTKSQVAILTGYAAAGGGFNNYLSALRGRELIAGSHGLQITTAGLTALGEFEPLPMGEELRAHWMRQLGKAERLVLDALCTAYPRPLTKAEVASSAGYEPSGGGFNNALSRLRKLELIDGRHELQASKELFS